MGGSVCFVGSVWLPLQSSGWVSLFCRPFCRPCECVNTPTGQSVGRSVLEGVWVVPMAVSESVSETRSRIAASVHTVC